NCILMMKDEEKLLCTPDTPVSIRFRACPWPAPADSDSRYSEVLESDNLFTLTELIPLPKQTFPVKTRRKPFFMR
ncbi:MAG: hypothetical protein J6P31_06040, partial [Oscillospiraceae bacterium]|nr:hypothetical protein [Oscillospiraceae bacterium]